MDDWHPATIPEVNEIVANDLKACDAEQLAAFDKYRIEPFSAPIVRYGQTESVVVVARKGDQVIYWEDVEDGSMSHRLVLMDKFLSTGAISTNYGLHLTPGSRAADGGGELGLLCL